MQFGYPTAKVFEDETSGSAWVDTRELISRCRETRYYFRQAANGWTEAVSLMRIEVSECSAAMAAATEIPEPPRNVAYRRLMRGLGRD